MTNPLIPQSSYSVSTGTAGVVPFIDIFETRNPTPYDRFYPIQKKWLNTLTRSLWILQNMDSSTGYVLANWVKLADPSLAVYGLNVPLGLSPVTVDANNRITFTSSDSSIDIRGSLNNVDFVSKDDSYYSLTPYIVGQNGDIHAQYTGPSGIQDATDAAVADGATNTNRANIYVKPGTYDAFVAQPGVNVISINRNLQAGQPGTVVIVGKISMNFTGSMEISGCELRTDGDYFLEMTGSSACIPTLKECYLNCLDNSGIHYTNSNAASTLFIDECESDYGDPTVALYVKTSPGTIEFSDSDLLNSANGTVASTDSAGGIALYRCTHLIKFQTTGTASMVSEYSGGGTSDAIIYDLQGTNGAVIEHFFGNSGTASCINIGGGVQVDVNYARITSSNANAISGAGTLSYSFLSFGTSSQIQNTITLLPTATKNPYGPVFRVITVSGTYTPTAGMKFCYVEATGGGAGGGGTTATGVGEVSVGSGGAGGGTGSRLFTAAEIGASQSVTIGAGGAGGIGTTGSDGGDTLFGAFLTGEGGTGGDFTGASTAVASDDADGGDGSGTLPIGGGPGHGGTAVFTGGTGFAKQGTGGSSKFGAGADGNGVFGATGGGNGKAAQIYGAGGSGANSIGSGGPFTGGSGSDGVVVITEYL